MKWNNITCRECKKPIDSAEEAVVIPSIFPVFEHVKCMNERMGNVFTSVEKNRGILTALSFILGGAGAGIGTIGAINRMDEDNARLKAERKMVQRKLVDGYKAALFVCLISIFAYFFLTSDYVANRYAINSMIILFWAAMAAVAPLLILFILHYFYKVWEFEKFLSGREKAKAL